MKEGDIIEWKGVNRIHQGRSIKMTRICGKMGGAPKGNDNARKDKQPQNNPKTTPNVNENVNVKRDTWSSWTMVAPFLSRLSGGQGQQN